MPNRIMAHMVAFYPDGELSLEIAKALLKGGCSLLEVQFPFSDPTADGRYIQKACDRAITAGFTLQGGFSLTAEIRKITDVPVFIMGYANSVVSLGVESFLDLARRSGATGLIVPDLPPDYDEGLFESANSMGLSAVPIVCPSTRKERLKRIFSLVPEFVYAVLRKGITGDYTKIGESNVRFLQKVSSGGAKVLAGFGLSTKQQVDALSRYVHAAVVGTAFVKEIIKHDTGDIRDAVYRKMKDLL